MVCSFAREMFQKVIPKRRDRRLLFMLNFIVVIGFLGMLNGSNVRYMTEDQLIRKYPNRHFQRRHMKRILIWKPFLDDNIVKTETACLKSCPARCEITTNKEDVANVDAVNFHLTNLWDKVWSIGTRSIMKFPTYRRPDQVWIVSNMEPPQHLWGDLKVFHGIFNWTQWYRTDADIQWRYGRPYKMSEKEKVIAYEKMQKHNIFKQKTREICGRISNCMDINRRYKTIKDMQNYLDIDMYGLCYNNPCGDPRNERDKSCNDFLKQYKFYLAFENNDCKDYVTEKYWQSLNREQIPIVNWKTVDRSIVIPNSYINIHDFSDIKSLARYIMQVSENETLFNSYFDWKKSYANRHRCASCQVCEALHDETRPAQVIEDLDSWVRNDVCQKIGVSVEL